MIKSYYSPLSDNCQIKTLPELYEEWFGRLNNGSFVEVGAFDGVNWSNTYGLAKLGWRGLLFEPQPDLYQKCVSNYRRLKGSVENCCIGDHNGRIKLYLGGSISTTVPEMVGVYNDMDWSRTCGLSPDRYIECDVFTLDTMLDKHAWPTCFELLVVDVEGAEMAVLCGISLDRYFPKMVIVEAHEDYPDTRLSGKAGLIAAHLSNYGYEKIYHDRINSIYWRKYG